MVFVLSIPSLLCLLTLAAHYRRADNAVMMFLVLGVCCLLLARRRWAARLAQITLVFGVFVWLSTTWSIVQTRIENGEKWKTAACILLSVAAFSLIAAALYQTRRLKAYYAAATPAKQSDARAASDA